MGFWIYYGYYIPTFFSSEVQPGRKKRCMAYGVHFPATLISWAIFSLATILLQRLVPLEWIAAEGYLSNNSARL